MANLESKSESRSSTPRWKKATASLALAYLLNPFSAPPAYSQLNQNRNYVIQQHNLETGKTKPTNIFDGVIRQDEFPESFGSIRDNNGLKEVVINVSNEKENRFYLAGNSNSVLDGSTPSSPAAVMQGNLHLFVRGVDNGIYYKIKETGNWNGWSKLDGATISHPSGVVDYDGRLHLLVAGTDRRIYENIFQNKQWSGFREVNGNGLTEDGPKAVSLDKFLKLFVRGINNRIYMNTYNGANWSKWQEVPGNGLTLSSPSAVTKKLEDGSYIVDLFVRGIDDRIYTNQGDGSARWSGWNEVPGNGLTNSQPAAFYENKTLNVYVKGTDGKIYKNSRNNEWSGWGIAVDTHAASGPDVLLDDKVKIFWRDSGNRILHNEPSLNERANITETVKELIGGANPAEVIGLNLEDANYALVLDGGTNIHAFRLNKNNPDLTEALYLGNKTQEFINAFGVRPVSFIGVNDINESNTSPEDDILYVRDINDIWREYPLIQFPTLEKLLAVRHPLGKVGGLEALFRDSSLNFPPEHIFAYNHGKEIDNLYAISIPLDAQIQNPETKKDISKYKTPGPDKDPRFNDPRLSRFRKPLKYYIDFSRLDNPQLFEQILKEQLDYWFVKTGITYVISNAQGRNNEEGISVRFDESVNHNHAGITNFYPNLRAKEGEMVLHPHPSNAYNPWVIRHENGHAVGIGYHPGIEPTFDPDLTYPPCVMNSDILDVSDRTSRLLREYYKRPYGSVP